MKSVTFLGSSLDDLKAFSAAARRSAGYELSRVQGGQDPSDWKPMPSVGTGVYEIRIHEDGQYRVFYVTKRAEAIYVLHAFRKRTQQTRTADIELGRLRLKLIGG
jgi:phage-related protein